MPKKEFEEARLYTIPNFSRYAISRDGDVFCVSGGRRGPFASSDIRRIAPVTHPRGKKWYVQMIDDTGKRWRIPIDKVKEAAFAS